MVKYVWWLRMKFKHIWKGKDCGTFEDISYEEAVESVLRWHEIEVREVE